MARFISPIAAGVLLCLWATGGVAQGPVGQWPASYAPPPPPAASTGPGNSPVPPDVYVFGPPELPRDRLPGLMVERLPPVEPQWPLLPVFPPLANSWDAAQPPAGPEAVPPGAPTNGSSESKDQPEAEKKEEPEIEGDVLPKMFEEVVIERTPWYDLEIPWLDPWEGSFEMGADGSSGNSETFNIRLGFTAARKTKRHSFLFDLDYHKNTNEAVETANRLYSEGRYERLSETKPWTWFFKQTTEYDEFQPWDVRVVSTSGCGYRFLDGDITSLTGRLGMGFSQQVGGFDQDVIPEMNYGFEYSHRMTKRQKIALSVDYFPNLVNYSEFRMVSKGDWEVLLDAENNLSLKISINDRYAYPNVGGKLNDLDYALVLLWSF